MLFDRKGHSKRIENKPEPSIGNHNGKYFQIWYQEIEELSRNQKEALHIAKHHISEEYVQKKKNIPKRQTSY